MIEVLALQEGGWCWNWISADGRILYQASAFPTDMAAWESARQWRSTFWAIADQIDHRQARAI